MKSYKDLALIVINFFNPLLGVCGIFMSELITLCQSHGLSCLIGVRFCWCHRNSLIVNFDSEWATLLNKSSRVRRQGDRMRFVIIKTRHLFSVSFYVLTGNKKFFFLVPCPSPSCTHGELRVGNLSRWRTLQSRWADPDPAWNRFMLVAREVGFYCRVVHSIYFFFLNYYGKDFNFKAGNE